MAGKKIPYGWQGDMSARWLTVTPLSGRTVLLVAVGVLLLTVGTVVGLWWWLGGSPPELAAARLDALRIGLSVGIGGGGLFALYLAWRRQRSTEETLRHQREVATATEADALERRTTDLYTKAVEQLGSDKAPVRLGGLYALERLAQSNPDQRQTIVNVLCAYLRMPFKPPEEAETDQHRIEEREVRLAAQRILGAHLQRGDQFWAGIGVDLTGALLIDFELVDAQVRTLTCRQARLVGYSSFDQTTFTDTVYVNGARFDGPAAFDGAVFERGARFDDVRFASSARFQRTRFSGPVRFSGARFEQGAWLEDAVFDGSVWFDDVRFTHRAVFDRVRFNAKATFTEVAFYVARPGDDAVPALLASLERVGFVGTNFAEGAPPEVVPFLDPPDEGL